MKNNSLALASLVFPLTLLAGDPPTDCTKWNQKRYSHCTHYAEKVADPFTQGYMMKLDLSVVTQDDEYAYPTIEFCQNSNSELNFYMDNEAGTYTMRYSLAYPDGNGGLDYRDHATQTFVHTGMGPADPNIFKVVIAKSTPITCDPSEDLKPFDESRRELNRVFEVK